MDEQRYRILLRVAIALTLCWVLWTLYDSGPRHASPDSQQLAAAGRQLEDGNYHEALQLFETVFRQDESNLGALRGMAQASMQLGLEAERTAQNGTPEEGDSRRSSRHFDEALRWYDRAITAAQAATANDQANLALGVTYANRGILRDHMGDHRGALEDYLASLRLAPEVAEGPGWLTRFLRNQPERPPDIAQRAAYIREQLDRPEGNRILRRPEVDSRQRSYTMD
jgi:tetratricopeptide (TPR) repeat protein